MISTPGFTIELKQPRVPATAQGYDRRHGRTRKKDELITLINPLDELYKGKSWK
jgi:hypothetical protein